MFCIATQLLPGLLVDSAPTSQAITVSYVLIAMKSCYKIQLEEITTPACQ